MSQPLAPLDATSSAPPAWVPVLIRQTIWQVVWIGLGMTVLVLSVLKARSIVSMLVIALFFSIAMDPAVTSLHVKRGWKRGPATVVVFAVVLASVILLFTVLIPALVQVADQIGARLPGWVASIEAFLGRDSGGSANQDLAAQLDAAITAWLHENATKVVGLASSGVGLVFQLLTTATFTFYLAADAPRIRRAVLVRLPPAKQERLGWAWDTAIKQTGGYFYSRMILLVINAALYFFVMVAVGVSWLVALPLSVFQAFFAEFIPVVGTYVGAAIPAVGVLGTLGAWQAVVLVVWTILYQQVENMWLSPKLSARSMEINGGVAFGAALLGGAVAGPMGAFMAMPVAALVTSFLGNYVRRYPLAYVSPYDNLDDTPAPEPIETGEEPGERGRGMSGSGTPDCD